MPIRAVWALLAILWVAAGCGDEEAVFRPLTLDVQGVSTRAETLLIRFAVGPGAPACQMVNPINAELFPALELAWTRSSMAERSLAVPGIEAENVTIIAVTLDATNALIQLGCAEVTFADLESPEIQVDLVTIP